MKLFIKKPIAQLMAAAKETEKTLKRTLGLGSLIALGIGAIIGAGIFVRTAAAAGEHAGPAVTISFLIAASGCALAGLCYAEFASMIPIAGSAYTYSYATMGEFVAWIIGWDLVLEYALGAATVAIGWSQYFNEFLNTFFNVHLPYALSHSFFEVSNTTTGMYAAEHGVRGIINLPAIFIILMLTLLLIRGMAESAIVNNVIVIIKVAIVLMIIALGWHYINPVFHTPYMIPADAGVIKVSTGTVNYADTFNHGWLGVLRGASVVFFAFIGFDAVSTAAQEAKNPQKDMPKGILISLAICTLLYILFSHVLTGLVSFKDFLIQGKEASVTYAIKASMPGYGWLANFVTVAILAGFSSVILVMLMGQTRVFYTMSTDGLIPPIFSKLHPKFRTPYKSQWLFFVFVSLFAGFIPDRIVGDMVSIGTLFAFVLVCFGIFILRRTDPGIKRPFQTPWYEIVCPLGAIICLCMIASEGWENWARLFVWLIIGLVIYFGYSIKRSNVRKIPIEEYQRLMQKTPMADPVLNDQSSKTKGEETSGATKTFTAIISTLLIAAFFMSWIKGALGISMSAWDLVFGEVGSQIDSPYRFVTAIIPVSAIVILYSALINKEKYLLGRKFLFSLPLLTLAFIVIFLYNKLGTGTSHIDVSDLTKVISIGFWLTLVGSITLFIVGMKKS